MCGHWSKEISDAYLQDLASPPPPPEEPADTGTGDAVVSRVAAQAARKALRYAMNRVARFTRSNVTPGECGSCGWHTDMEADEEMQPRVHCFYCSKCVCRRWCCFPEHLVCTSCHPGNDPPGPATMPPCVPRTETGEVCFSCGRAVADLVAVVASGSVAIREAVSPAGRQPLRRCTRCNRWLCFDCRQLQAPTVCVVCPALHKVELPSLRQVRTGPSAQDLERLREAANRATVSRGRGRLSTGQFMHQQDIDGRAFRAVSSTGKRARLDE